MILIKSRKIGLSVLIFFGLFSAIIVTSSVKTFICHGEDSPLTPDASLKADSSFFFDLSKLGDKRYMWDKLVNKKSTEIFEMIRMLAPVLREEKAIATEESERKIVLGEILLSYYINGNPRSILDIPKPADIQAEIIAYHRQSQQGVTLNNSGFRDRIASRLLDIYHGLGINLRYIPTSGFIIYQNEFLTHLTRLYPKSPYLCASHLYPDISYLKCSMYGIYNPSDDLVNAPGWEIFGEVWRRDLPLFGFSLHEVTQDDPNVHIPIVSKHDRIAVPITGALKMKEMEEMRNRAMQLLQEQEELTQTLEGEFPERKTDEIWGLLDPHDFRRHVPLEAIERCRKELTKSGEKFYLLELLTTSNGFSVKRCRIQLDLVAKNKKSVSLISNRIVVSFGSKILLTLEKPLDIYVHIKQYKKDFYITIYKELGCGMITVYQLVDSQMVKILSKSCGD